MGPFDSLSDVPGAVWVNLTVCQIHQLMCGSVCQCVRCTRCCWGLYDSVSDEPVVV